MGDILKIGHRGAKGHLAENTLESMALAVKLAVDAIELDVHRCKTGELVVIHDFTLERTTNGKGKVADKTFRELKKLEVEGKHRIPSLDEVLVDFAGKCRINIELKGDNTAAAVCDLLRDYIENRDRKSGDFLISSFRPELLIEVNELNPSIPLGVLTEDDLAEAVGLGKKLKAEAIVPQFELFTAKDVREMKNEGFKVITWTVNDPEAIQLAKEMGVDGIISDFPDRL